MRTTFGKTGLKVSPVAFGSFGLGGGWGTVSEENLTAVRRAYELGVNFFDSAFGYGSGAAEAVLGRCLADIIRTERDEVVLLTKGGVEAKDGAYFRNSDASFLRESLIEGLKHLNTDYIDIYLIHWPDPTIPLAETAGVLKNFVDEGLARHIGISNASVDQMNEFSRGADIEVAQLPYNLFRRNVEDGELAYCADREIGVMGYQPYAGGLLTGALRTEGTFTSGDWRAKSPEYQGEMFSQLSQVVDRLRDLAGERNCSIAQLALAWVLSCETTVVPVTGAETSEHIESTVGGLSIKLSAAERDALTALAADITQISKSGPKSRPSHQE